MKSVSKSSQNTLTKSFERQAVKLVEDAHYEAKDFNRETFMFTKIHPQAIERLNTTMSRLNEGNAQIFVTMFYKDQDRAKLIVKFAKRLLSSKAFKSMPRELQDAELKQLKKLGPTSRFKLDKLMESFVLHVDKTEATKCEDYQAMQEAFDALVEYQTRRAKKALKEDPSLNKYLEAFQDVSKTKEKMPKDKSGGYEYFANVDDKIAGETANDLYYRDYEKWRKQPTKEMLYEMYCRVQNKGNTMFDNYEIGKPFNTISLVDDPWLDEKNRVVQGDSRSCQFPHKPISDLLTQVVKAADPNLLGWRSMDERIPLLKNFFKEFYGKFNFDSFDATEYDATTDPEVQKMGIRSMYKLARNLGCNPDALLPEDVMVRHFLNDPTITPKGIWRRNSTPSGHNFTGPAGTEINLGRMWRQTAELFNVTAWDLISIVEMYADKSIPVMMAVGDDGGSLRGKDETQESIAKKNRRDGFTSNNEKIELSDHRLHFLQLENIYIPDHPDLGYYSVYAVSRALEKFLFQEKADEHTAESASIAAQQSLSNCRYNPCLDILASFEVEGDAKYRLGGTKPGEFAKKAAKGQSVAEAIHREWDPVYKDMTWEQYSIANRATYQAISRAAQKFSKARSEL